MNVGRLLKELYWRVHAVHGKGEVITKRTFWSGVVWSHQVPILTWLEVPDNPLFIHLHLASVGLYLLLLAKAQFLPVVYLVIICISPKLPNASTYQDKWFCFVPQHSKTLMYGM